MGLLRNQKLLRHAMDEVPEPRHYYTGLQPGSAHVPVNILVFPRLSRAYMERWHTKPTAHQRYVLMVALEGTALVQLESLSISITPGVALLVHPFQLHRAIRFDREKIAWFYVSFESADAPTLALLRDTPVRVPAAAWEHLASLAIDYRGRGAKPEPVRNRIALRLALALNELAAASPATPTRPVVEPTLSPADRLVEDACRFIAERLESNLRIADVASRLHVSESHLRLLFRRGVGTPLGQYMRSVQMYRAAKLLALSEMTISQVATRCGFDSIFAFSRAFRREMQVPPTEYRRRFGPPARAGHASKVRARRAPR